MIFLNVDYSEKDKAKQMGARWNPEFKKWYVESPKQYYKFAEWINGNTIVSENFYLIEGETHCWKCKEKTKVIAFGVEKYMLLYGEPCGFTDDNEIHIANGLETLPKFLKDYILKNYAVKERFSKTIGRKYMSNGCSHCDALQGDWFLFSEPDSPFFIDSKDKVKGLKFYKITLPFDLALNISISWGSQDYLLKENAQIENLAITVKP